MTRLRFWLGAYVEFQPVGWPGWAWGGLCEVCWEGDNARGSRPHEGGFAKKINCKFTNDATMIIRLILKLKYKLSGQVLNFTLRWKMLWASPDTYLWLNN